VAVPVTVVAVGLHFYFLFHAGGFWRDEVNLINLAGLHSLRAMSADSFPVFMPLLIRFWEIIGLGKTDAGLRLLGALIGLGLPAALWLMAWKFRRSPPLAGLALLALNGTVIVFGDSLRAHGLGSLLILLTAAAAGWFLQKTSWKRAAVWAVLSVLSVQTLFQNAVFIFAICAGAWAVCARQKKIRAAFKVFLVGLAAAVSLLPYLTNFISLNVGASSLRTGIAPARLLATFDAAAGFPMEQSRWLWFVFALAVFVIGITAIFSRAKTPGGIAPAKFFLPVRWTMLLAALTAAAGFFWFAVSPANRWWFFLWLGVAVALLDRNRAPAELKTAAPASVQDEAPARDGDLSLFAGVTLLVAVVGFAGFLWYAALPTEPWYFIPLLALAAGCFEIGLPARGHARAAVLGFSGVTAVIACVVIFSDQKMVNWRFTNLDLLCPQLAAEAAPGDFVIVSPWYCGISFQRYFKSDVRWETVPPLADHAFARYDLIHEQMQKTEVVRPLIEQAEAALRAGHRVWLVGMMAVPAPGETPPADLPPPPLKFSGWSDRPYTETWVLQVNQFLSNHSREFKMVFETPNGNLNFMENVQLYRVEGWHD
jgi:hypothetical protein